MNHPINIKMRQLHIHALGINTGGGLILLQQLLKHNNGALGYLCLDHRIRQKIKPAKNIIFYQHSLVTEWKSQRALSQKVRPQDHVLFFSNRPPLIKFNCKVSVFHQNALLLQKTNFKSFKSTINQIWFKLFKNNSNQFIVQNQSMRKLLSNHGCHNTSVINAAFFDSPPLPSSTEGHGFIYVASFAPHKNHKQLIKAWEYLIYNGLREPLTLITSGDSTGLSNLIKQSPAKKLITHLRNLSREDVFSQYKKHKALVFPSEIESLGLPLLEAQSNGLAIIASEKDYVRDIIKPDQSFDPSSYISIARAVMRFLDFQSNKGQVISSEEFINTLLEKTKVSAPKAS